MHENVFFQRLDAGFNPVADEEVIVDHNINQMIKEIIGPVHFFFPKNRLQGTKLIDFLFRNRNDIMTAKKNIKRTQENFLIVESYAVNNDKIMAFMNFNLRTLLLFTETILNCKLMKLKYWLQNFKIIDIRINPIKSFGRRYKRRFNILNWCKYTLIDQTGFSSASSPLILVAAIPRMPVKWKRTDERRPLSHEG